jgi:hypothetical protein
MNYNKCIQNILIGGEIFSILVFDLEALENIMDNREKIYTKICVHMIQKILLICTMKRTPDDCVLNYAMSTKCNFFLGNKNYQCYNNNTALVSIIYLDKSIKSVHWSFFISCKYYSKL